MLAIHNVAGYAMMAAYLVAAAFIAPPEGDPWMGLLAGLAYFLVVWLIMGVYLGDVVHLGLAHRSLDVAPWFVYAITLLANTIGIYLNPRTWTNRHRLHHAYSDRPGDPNKRAHDGFLATCYRMLFPYPSVADLVRDPIFDTWPMRLVSTRWFAVLSQFTSFAVAWALAAALSGDWPFALVLWLGVRWVTAYVHIVQNYWTHEPRHGSRRYDDADNAMNITNVLPVTLTFSACLQNNHHHSPRFVRLSHSASEYDFGFLTVRLMVRLGLATPTEEGRTLPEGSTLSEVGL